jgi:hypothetical protein
MQEFTQLECLLRKILNTGKSYVSTIVPSQRAKKSSEVPRVSVDQLFAKAGSLTWQLRRKTKA